MKRQVSSDDINLSFSGCGFLGLYHIGVAKGFLKYAPECFSRKVCGASAGSLVAAAIVCGLDLDECAKKIEEIVLKARQYRLNSFSYYFRINDLLYNLLDELLPNDCYTIATGRLYISVTRYSDMSNRIISEYKSKEELINTILCSCFIPGWTRGNKLKIRGDVYIDGFFSVNQPILDEHTVTVSPFVSVSTDISPKNPIVDYEVELFKSKFSVTPENIRRFAGVVFALHPSELYAIMNEGYDNALKYMEIEKFLLPF